MGRVCPTILFSSLYLMLLLSRGLQMSWRKPWGGPLVVHWRVRFLGNRLSLTGTPLSMIVGLGHRRIRLYGWGYVQLLSPSLLYHPELRRIGFHWMRDIWPQLSWCLDEGWIELGSGDPAQMGRWQGILSALPPQWSSRVRLTFAQVGWRSRGKASVSGASLDIGSGGIRVLFRIGRKHLLSRRK